MTAPAPLVGYVLTCTEQDASTGDCITTAWMPAGPSLTVEQAQEIGLAIALLWAGAWVIRQIKRTLMQD